MSVSPARCGYEPASGLYFEVLEGVRAERPPILMIHGGGATGACFRVGPLGRPGWADGLAARLGHCWVTDWPGTGRSGVRDVVDISYIDVVDGYRRLLREVIAEPVVVVCHSMGGAVAWQLLEHEPGLVAGVVAVAAAAPGNTPPRSEVLRDDGEVVEAIFGATGVAFRVERHRAYFYEDAYIHDQAIATSTRFPADWIPAFRAGLVGLPPTMLLQRLGVVRGLPTVGDPSGFVDCPIRLVAGGEDPAHTRVIEEATVACLRAWGADARLVWLPDEGFVGNGHFLFFEDNADETMALIADLIEELQAA